MYTSPWQVEVLVKDRQNQYRREAEQYRMVKLAQAGRERFAEFRSTMRWIARQMIALGCRMQRRFALASASIQRPASECAAC